MAVQKPAADGTRDQCADRIDREKRADTRDAVLRGIWHQERVKQDEAHAVEEHQYSRGQRRNGHDVLIPRAQRLPLFLCQGALIPDQQGRDQGEGTADGRSDERDPVTAAVAEARIAPAAQDDPDAGAQRSAEHACNAEHTDAAADLLLRKAPARDGQQQTADQTVLHAVNDTGEDEQRDGSGGRIQDIHDQTQRVRHDHQDLFIANRNQWAGNGPHGKRDAEVQAREHAYNGRAGAQKRRVGRDQGRRELM